MENLYILMITGGLAGLFFTLWLITTVKLNKARNSKIQGDLRLTKEIKALNNTINSNVAEYNRLLKNNSETYIKQETRYKNEIIKIWKDLEKRVDEIDTKDWELDNMLETVELLETQKRSLVANACYYRGLCKSNWIKLKKVKRWTVLREELDEIEKTEK